MKTIKKCKTMCQSITAVIPVKENSSRLPGKNFLPFGNFETLLDNKLNQLTKVKEISQILVSSDSEKARAISRNYGVEFIKRPIEYANETKPLSDFFRYIGTLLKTEHILWACVTSPLIDHYDYVKAIKIYNEISENSQFDSLITVAEYQHYLMDSKGPLNYELGENHKNSDQLEKLHLFTNGILICSTQNLIKWGYNYGAKAYRLIIPQEKSIDIDTKWDYLTAIAWEKELKK